MRSLFFRRQCFCIFYSCTGYVGVCVSAVTFFLRSDCCRNLCILYIELFNSSVLSLCTARLAFLFLRCCVFCCISFEAFYMVCAGVLCTAIDDVFSFFILAGSILDFFLHFRYMYIHVFHLGQIDFFHSLHLRTCSGCGLIGWWLRWDGPVSRHRFTPHPPPPYSRARFSAIILRHTTRSQHLSVRALFLFLAVESLAPLDRRVPNACRVKRTKEGHRALRSVVRNDGSAFGMYCCTKNEAP